mmetsp:Transcript_52015/g.135867  ORF Transcript_52015/g.135867 Transcript_52015/m.135867 type:complete len:124 (-) Transcript_52015:867-1238(-)
MRQEGGAITWDYDIFSVPTYLYHGNAQRRHALEVLSMVLLGLNTLSELGDIVEALRKFQVMGYLRSWSNVLDWCHFTLMAAGWYYWFSAVRLSNTFHLDPAYQPLVSPAAQTRARLFLTDPVQ